MSQPSHIKQMWNMTWIASLQNGICIIIFATCEHQCGHSKVVNKSTKMIIILLSLLLLNRDKQQQQCSKENTSTQTYCLCDSNSIRLLSELITFKLLGSFACVLKPEREKKKVEEQLVTFAVVLAIQIIYWQHCIVITLRRIIYKTSPYSPNTIITAFIESNIYIYIYIYSTPAVRLLP